MPGTGVGALKWLVLVAGFAAIAWFAWPRSPIALPPEPARTPVAEPSQVDFAGSEACAQCHASEYQRWSRSTHGRAGALPPRADIVFARFDGTPIRFRDATVTPRVAGGSYTFTIDQPGRPPQTLRVDGVVGGGHMYGGGTQGFVSRQPDGTLRFLPFEVTRRRSAWFCNTTTRTNRGWQPITPDMSIADCGDWPPVRVLGNTAEFATCQECHGSQIQLAFEARAYRTRLQSLSINCESCHGPGRRHAENPSVAMPALATLDKQQSVRVCLQCHALKTPLESGYLPGKSFARYYSVGLATLGDSATYPDGRTRTFAYQQGHLSSDCYVNGSLTCVDCHEPHAQTYRTHDGRPLAGRFDDGQCTSCHRSKLERPAAHTRHPPAVRCTSCHMPYLQERDVGSAIAYRRADHTISIPRPAYDAQLGITSACKTCHVQSTEAQLAAQTRRLWGSLKPPAQHTMRDIAELSAALESGTEVPAQRLRALAQQPDPDLKALALATLHYRHGDQRRTRRFLANTLRQLGNDDAHVRRRWTLVLGWLGDTGARDAYARALELMPSDPALLLSAGRAAAQAGDHAAAIAFYRRALAADSTRALTWLNLGLSLSAMGDEAGAIRAWVTDTLLNPYEPFAQFNLGNRALTAQQYAEAARLYERALMAAPGLAEAHFRLARSYIFMRQYEKARVALSRGLELDPTNEPARQILQQVTTEP